MYPEYTGTLLSAVAEQKKEPTSEQGAYEEAKAFVEKHGFTLLEKTPFSDSDALATLPAYAERAQPLEHRRPEAARASRVTLGGPRRIRHPLRRPAKA